MTQNFRKETDFLWRKLFEYWSQEGEAWITQIVSECLYKLISCNWVNMLNLRTCNTGQVCLIPTACQGLAGLGDLVKACWPSPSRPAPVCGTWSAVFSVCWHNNYPGTCISLSIFSMNTSVQEFDLMILFVCFVSSIKRIWYINLYNCSVLSIYCPPFSVLLVFDWNTKYDAHIFTFCKPSPPKKKMQLENEKVKQFIFSLSYCYSVIPIFSFFILGY